jgi:hypothetical protein
MAIKSEGKSDVYFNAYVVLQFIKHLCEVSKEGSFAKRSKENKEIERIAGLSDFLSKIHKMFSKVVFT